MAYVIAAPEFVSAAASELSNLGSTISAANAAAAPSTTAVLPAAADEVSAGIAALFEAQAQAFQALNAQAAGFHAQFVQLLTRGAVSYAATEAANVQLSLPSSIQNLPSTIEQDLLSVVNAPTQLLLGRPVIGNGANGGRGRRAGPVGC